LIPKENERDLKEIKEPVKEGLKIIPVEEIKEAFPIVFGKNWNQKKTSRKK
jgi:ATP-dependent Lon protease